MNMMQDFLTQSKLRTLWLRGKRFPSTTRNFEQPSTVHVVSQQRCDSGKAQIRVGKQFVESKCLWMFLARSTSRERIDEKMLQVAPALFPANSIKGNVLAKGGIENKPCNVTRYQCRYTSRTTSAKHGKMQIFLEAKKMATTTIFKTVAVRIHLPRQCKRLRVAARAPCDKRSQFPLHQMLFGLLIIKSGMKAPAQFLVNKKMQLKLM